MVEGDGRQLSPLFFVSHARTARRVLATETPDPHVTRFYVDLCQNVDALVGPPIGVDLGYVDQSMNVGEQWEPQLDDALNTCQSFVALLSPSFGRSEYCLREWQRFERRPVITRRGFGHSDRETAIVPVVWVPFRINELPPRLRGVQHFSPDGLPRPEIAALYKKFGILGLLQTMQEDTYLSVMWMLARRVATICNEHQVEPAARNEMTP